MKTIILSAITSVLLLAACNKKSTEAAAPVQPQVQQQPKDSSVYYTVSVKPITDKYCISCHSNQTYIKDLNSYSALKGESDNGVLNDRLYVKQDMPPYGSPKPTKAELDIIKKWMDGGCKE